MRRDQIVNWIDPGNHIHIAQKSLDGTQAHS